MEENTNVQAEETTALEESFDEAFSDEVAEDETSESEDFTEEEVDESKEEFKDESSSEESADERLIEIDGKEYAIDDIKNMLKAEPDYPDAIKNLAKMANMSVTDYLAMVENAAIENQINSRVQQLINQDVSEDLAGYIAKIEQENEKFKRSEQEAKERSARDRDVKAQIEAFNRLYPDVRELPKEVIEDINKTGSSPVEAYQRYLLDSKERELKVLKQEKKNKMTTPGAVKGNGAVVTNPFLSEFMKD